jgi:FkbM family methyltransferase
VLAASVQQILDRLRPTDVVLDIGGWGCPFTRADWVMDLQPYATRGLYGLDGPLPERFTEATWIVRDICDRAPFPFADKELDFVVCSHTLEDIRDPIWVCQEMVRVAKAGYIEVPSRLEEQSWGFQGPWVGWGHHRWLVDEVDGGLEFTFKHHVLHARDTDHFPAGFRDALSREQQVLTFWWDDSFTVRERVMVEAEEVDGYLAGFVAEHRNDVAVPPPRRLDGVPGMGAVRVVARPALRAARRARGEVARRRAEAAEQRRRAGLASVRLLDAFATAYPDAVFVEVGSNDGDQHDHLRPHIRSGRWRGIMVEPVPYVFERLRANYGDLPQVRLENVAIADREGQLPFFELAEPTESERADLPPWYDAISSFSLDAIMSHADKIPDLERRVQRTEVTCTTFEALWRRNGFDHLDLLLIDTEGYDWEILRTIDLAALHPALVAYEHYHLPAEVRRASRAHLEALGYDVLAEAFDTWCLHRDAHPALRAAWAGLEAAVPELSADERPG